jgi:hypothetical protein
MSSPLRTYTVWVAATVVKPNAAMPGPTIVEMRDVKAPTREAALNVGAALAVDQLAGSRRVHVNKVWLSEPPMR